jgi:hypothetical protein
MILTDQQIKNVIITALEGGSNYWYYLPQDSKLAIRSRISKEENPYISEAITDAVLSGADVNIHDAEEPSDVLGMLTSESIAKGLDVAIANYPEEIQDVITEEYDAGTADTLFQLFVMGEVVFG